MAEEGVTREERETLRALLVEAHPGPLASAVNTVDHGTSLDISHDEMLRLIGERIRRGGSRMFIVHAPDANVADGPLVIADTGNGPRSGVHAALIAKALNCLPRMLDTLDAAENLLSDAREELGMHEALVADLGGPEEQRLPARDRLRGAWLLLRGRGYAVPWWRGRRRG